MSLNCAKIPGFNRTLCLVFLCFHTHSSFERHNFKILVFVGQFLGLFVCLRWNGTAAMGGGWSLARPARAPPFILSHALAHILYHESRLCQEQNADLAYGLGSSRTRLKVELKVVVVLLLSSGDDTRGVARTGFVGPQHLLAHRFLPLPWEFGNKRSCKKTDGNSRQMNELPGGFLRQTRHSPKSPKKGGVIEKFWSLVRLCGLRHPHGQGIPGVGLVVQLGGQRK